MAGRPDPVLSYLDDTLARCVATMEWLRILSHFIDEEGALDIALKIRELAIEQRQVTLEWRKRREEMR